MSNDLPVPPKVDLEYAAQFVGQLYGSIAVILDARRQVAEWNSQAEAAQARLREVEQQFFQKERLLREVTGKLDAEKMKCEQWTQKAEKARVELSGVESVLNEARAQKAALKAAL